MYINAQSILYKIDELREYIVEVNPDVICVTDRSSTNKDINDCEVVNYILTVMKLKDMPYIMEEDGIVCVIIKQIFKL